MNNNITKRIVVVTVVVGLAVIFKILGLGQYFTLSYVKASQGKLAALYADYRLMIISAYMVIYILVTSLSLPGAAIITSQGGRCLDY